MTDLTTAAQARALAQVRQADRPSRRRCAEGEDSRPIVTVRAHDVQVRAKSDDGPLEFEGYASVTDTGYEMYDMFGPYTEMVAAGSFAKTLAQSGLDVPLVLAHDSLRRIARTTNGTLQLSEDSNGLHVLAQLDPTDADVAYIVPKLRSGLVDEMSFKFMITAGQWSPDFTEFHIEGADIDRGDVAIVGYGANPATAGSGLRAADLRAMSDDALKRLQTKVGAELRSRGSAGMSRAALDLLAASL